MKIKRVLLAVLLAAGLVLGTSPARADVTNSSGDNVQDGDNSADATQGGSSGSGDAVGGMVSGIVSSGDASVDAKNRSEDVDVESGESHGTNDASPFTGLAKSENSNIVVSADVDGLGSLSRANIQDGDNDFTLTQTADASSGDAVGGQVIGAVVSAGGSADVVADNSSKDVDGNTGDGDAATRSSTYVGLANVFGDLDVGPTAKDVTDIENAFDANVQDGDDSADVSQSSTAASGDGVGGQVIGVVSAGDTSVDAKNSSEDVDVETGIATASDTVAADVGETFSEEAEIDVFASDISGLDSTDNLNAQDGDNDLTVDQTSDAATGDGVAGQVIGSVTSAGGSADIVADNSSEDVDINTGDADASNESNGIVGLPFNETGGVHAGDIGDLRVSDSLNAQDGDNSQDVTQSAGASSGDGVGGQVIGVVSAGDTSVDAKNSSTDADLDTGNATSDNESNSIVGLAMAANGNVSADDLTDIDVDENANLQDGDNDASLDQTSDASTGDAVGGQVIGDVTSAGGSADIVADNASEDVDVGTGDAETGNENDVLVGLALSQSRNVQVSDISGVGQNDSSPEESNLQDGDNSQDATQSATATSGDGVAGQVIGAVSAGDTSIDAKNRSGDVDVDTGGAFASNDSDVAVGLAFADEEVTVDDVGPDVDITNDANVQDGDNDESIDQTAAATTGDGVGGQVIGVVTSAGGSADIVADDSSNDVDIQTGDADRAFNENNAFVGLSQTDGGEVFVSDVNDVTLDFDGNVQDGDNSQDVSQSATASTGDGVGGQVIGAVSAGDTSIDGKNSSTDVDIDTGNADAENDSSANVGLSISDGNDVDVSDVEDVTIDGDQANVQDGDNDLSVDQTTSAATGDGVGGQVIGAVTSGGGSADIVADNSSEDVDIETGTADSDNNSSALVGLANGGDAVDVTDLSNIDAPESSNLQDGDNGLDVTQSASASSGDGVGGQVLGVVSAGDASVDAKNKSEDVDLESGPADASNDAQSLVGLALAVNDNVVVSDISGSNGTNLQDGDNDGTVDQTADASSGDAVGGEVAGAVVSAGGSADAALDNTSEDVDASTGPSDFTTDDDLFVGQAFASNELIVGGLL